MSRSIHQTTRGVLGGKSDAEIKALITDGLDPDVEALVTKSGFKRGARAEHRCARDAATLQALRRELLTDTTRIDDARVTLAPLLSTEAVGNDAFADALELWVAAVLAGHPWWPRQGRWSDGLVVDALVGDAVSDDTVGVRGRIWLIDRQRAIALSASVSSTSTDFDLHITDDDHREYRARRGAEVQPFPMHRWGMVDGDDVVDAVRIEASGGGFLFITIETGTTRDVWLEHADDVVDALDSLRIEWDPASIAFS